jgi:hypothetical protein
MMFFWIRRVRCALGTGAGLEVPRSRRQAAAAACAAFLDGVISIPVRASHSQAFR